MSVTFQKFCFVSRSQVTGNNFAISGISRLKSHKGVTHYSLLGNVSHTKTYPGILNISLSISIVHQSIDISKFSVCHLHYIPVMCVKNYLTEKLL